MSRKKIESSIFFVLLIFTFVINIFALDESRASKTWEVLKYDITATLPQTETDRNLSVKAILNLKNTSGNVASRLTLRISPNAEVLSVKVNDTTTDFSKGEEKITGNSTLQRIQVRLPSIQSSQTFSVAVDYKLNVKENSALSALSPIGSQFLPLSFWYPTPNSWYFARGADYAPFSLKVRAPVGLMVLSSGSANVTGTNSEVASAFEQKLNAQPFFVAGNWDVVNANNVSVFIPKGVGTDEQKRAGELAALASDAKSFSEKLLGSVTDVPIRLVSVNRGGGFSSGGTIFVDDSVFRGQKIDSQTAMTIADAIAKIWLGNSVIAGGEANGVIREGLTRFIATQFIESKYGKDVAEVERLRQRTAYGTVVSRDAPLNMVSPLDDYYYNAVGNKGAMVWRLLSKTVGQDEFFNKIRAQMKDGNLELSEIRSAFPAQKELLDYAFDKVTDMDLLIGLPQSQGAETKVALRNVGSIDAEVNIVATTSNGESLIAQAMIPAKSFGEAAFKTGNKIIRVEIDSEKIYPQTDYSDDVAPREFNESDAFLVVKRLFDKQDFAGVEKNARNILKFLPRFDDIRVLLARSLLAQSKTSDAEKEFQAVLIEKLPTSRSLAWANAGLGEIAQKSGNASQAIKFFNETIRSDAEYGATLFARQGRNKINASVTIEDSVKEFFTKFDKAAVSGRKAELDAIIAPGEIQKFAGGIAGQAEQWQTKIVQVDKIDANDLLVETFLNTKFLNKTDESGTAVFRLSKISGNWKLSAVEVFEVR